jgi:hypothetical protein
MSVYIKRLAIGAAFLGAVSLAALTLVWAVAQMPMSFLWGFIAAVLLALSYFVGREVDRAL